MKIIFLKDYEVQDSEAKTFKKGQVVDLKESSANHFIKRGVAEISTEKQAPKKEAQKKETK